jgi:hypothetical protein
MGGVTGLDYSPLFRLMDERGLKGEAWRDAFDGVRIIESSAIEQMRLNEKNK